MRGFALDGIPPWTPSRDGSEEVTTWIEPRTPVSQLKSISALSQPPSPFEPIVESWTEPQRLKSTRKKQANREARFTINFIF